uniref:Uncharacterized protein n=1 Tax=Arundo donax TaxID=35708 RepID=A0A0A9CC57_ARUDO
MALVDWLRIISDVNMTRCGDDFSHEERYTHQFTVVSDDE